MADFGPDKVFCPNFTNSNISGATRSYKLNFHISVIPTNDAKMKKF